MTDVLNAIVVGLVLGGMSTLVYVLWRLGTP